MDYPIIVDFNCENKISRLTTFLRPLLIIPQWIVLYFICIAASIVIFIVWWAILFTGRYPRWAFNFVAGYVRWYTRVSGYYCLLTDKYPPFSLE